MSPYCGTLGRGGGERKQRVSISQQYLLRVVKGKGPKLAQLTQMYHYICIYINYNYVNFIKQVLTRLYWYYNGTLEV